jgi:Ser/Thr protein kinase RdoA (MazF antagonist)
LDFTEPFAYAIPHFYDTDSIVTTMLETDAAHTGSEKYAACHPIATTIHERLEKLGGYVVTPKRVLHGDLRFNNFRFDSDGIAIALIDLDTLGRYPLPIEIGNMLRSWCSSRQAARPSLNFDTWQAAINGYRAAAHFITDEEWRVIPHGFEQVTLELAARYLTDAYLEKYFAHDPVYPSLFEQNIDRARFCLAIHDEFGYNREIVARMFFV